MAAAAAATVVASTPLSDEELAAVARKTVADVYEAVRCGDAGRAEDALQEVLSPQFTPYAFTFSTELAAAGGVAAVLAAVEAFGLARPVFLFFCSAVFRLLSTLETVPSDLEAAWIAVLRIALHAPAAADEAGQLYQRLGLTDALCSAEAAETDAALRAEVLAAGAVERLVAAVTQSKNSLGFKALVRVCGPLEAPLDACARRLVTGGAVDVAIAALQQTCGKSDDVDVPTNAAQLLMVMHDKVRQSGASDEALISAFRGRQAEIIDALVAWLSGPVRACSVTVTSLVGALISFAKSAEGVRCSPEQAVAATEGLLDVLRFVLTEHADPETACTCAFALMAFTGACGGTDTAAPGTHALRAGAQPLVEAAVEAAKRSGNVSSQVIETATIFLRTLRGLDASATPPDAELEARLQRAENEDNMAELISLARDGIQRCDADLIMRAFNPLLDVITAADGASEKLFAEAVAAGGVAFVVNAVKACGRAHPLVLEGGCVLLKYFADLQPPPPRVVASSIVALRVALNVEPATDPHLAGAQVNALSRVICAARVAGDASLRAEALEAGAVERLLVGARWLLSSPSWSGLGIANLLLALFELCGQQPSVPDACALRVITAGGVDVAVSASRLRNSGCVIKQDIALAGAQLLARLQSVARTVPTRSEEIVSAFRDEAAIFALILDGIPGLDIATAAVFVGWLPNFSMTVNGGPCAPSHAAKATEATMAVLRRMSAEDKVSLAGVSYCARALGTFAGGCSVDDAAAPGTYALRLGALPLLESMLPAVNAELAAARSDKGARKQFSLVTDCLSKLRALEARREAAAAALVAEEEAEHARRSKAAKNGKAAAAKAKAKKGSAAAAAAAKKPQPAEVDKAAAALGAMAIADASAGAAAGGPPPAEAVPAAPPAAPLQAAQAAPPPLPPWLTQAMQQPPPSPPPPAAASRAAQAQRPPHIAAASTQRQPVSSPPAGMSAGDLVPRELECAICLDAAAEGRTRCCGQTAFCRPCAATLTGECPLCRAPPRAA
jgi:hypothetical protein